MRYGMLEDDTEYQRHVQGLRDEAKSSVLISYWDGEDALTASVPPFSMHRSHRQGVNWKTSLQTVR